MTSVHDFGYSLHLLFPTKKEEEEEREKE